jgi:hypothetical protein
MADKSKKCAAVYINLLLVSDVATGKEHPNKQVGCIRLPDGTLGNAYVAFDRDADGQNVPVITQSGYKINLRMPEGTEDEDFF